MNHQRDAMRLACVAVFVAALASTAPAATFVVTSSADSGPGTLRQAILDANATPGRDAIVFDLTRVFTRALPPVTDAVDIDGRLPDDSRVQINSLSGIYDGFFFNAGSDGSTLRDVTTVRFDTSIHVASGVSDVHVFRNEVRTSRVFMSGDRTIVDDGNFFCCQLTIFGGNANVVTGNRILHVGIQLGANHRVSGNALRDVSTQQTASLIVENNVFSVSICPDCIGIHVQDSIGPAPSVIRGNTVIGGRIGIGVVGGLAIVQDNLVRDSTTGIGVTGTAVTLTRNSITGGTIAIDLGADGPTPNDPAPDPDTGANNRQNFPVLTAARRSPGALAVSGTLASALSTPYTIELFSNPASDPKARTFVGSVDVTTDATGNAAFQALFTSNVPPAGEVITATATNRAAAATVGNAPNETSELSAPVVVADTPNSDIPTVSTWGLLALAFALAAVALLRK